MCKLLPIRGGGELLNFQDSGGGGFDKGEGNSGGFETPVGAMF